jgi:GH25 family lysozyme M1 (1,4-beta-N-acetylmuramidase)
VTDPVFIDVSYYQAAMIPTTAWPTLAADPAYCGVVLKATEGLGGPPRWDAWLRDHWPAVRDAYRRESRYGQSAFRGAYHFLLLSHHGAAQADHYLRTIERAGGWDVGDVWPILDVEKTKANQQAVDASGPMIVVDTVRDFVRRIDQVTGRDTILYGGRWINDIGVRSRMGCSWLWWASYTETLSTQAYAPTWTPDRLWAWQYAGGAGTARLAGYPTTSPLGPTDLSALTLPGGFDAMRRLLWAESPVHR